MNIPETLAIDHIMEVLEKLSPVEWGRLLPGKAQPKRLNYPPLIVWRFREASNTVEHDLGRVEGKIFDAIKHFKGHVKWSIQKPGRNIVLTTAMFWKFENSGGFRSDAEVLKTLAAIDPKHGNEAHTDLAAIVEMLDRLAIGKSR